MKRWILFFVFLLALQPCFALKHPLLSMYRDSYITFGMPLDRALTKDNADIKFQLSVKLHPIDINPKWQFYVAYTQLTVWNAFGKSSPFKDNMYMPGFYFEGDLGKGNRLITGYEHRSNGRPYFGNPRSTPEKDDYSRGMNYLKLVWDKNWGNSDLVVSARAGFSAGVGDHARRQKMFTQDLFLYYLGYVTVGYCYDNGKLGADVFVTPIGNKSIANVTAEGSWQFHPKLPRLFLQFHYGFDEALCDCVAGGVPPVSLRIGFLFNAPAHYKPYY
ncbi:MAG: phospholipase A [Bacteroidales bacterium]|nr:phospholipase A [Bacteroidales bacterium]